MNNKAWMGSAVLSLALSAGAASAAGFVTADAAFAETVSGVTAKVVAEVKTARLADGVVRDQTTLVNVDLNAKTVKCSAADYSAPMLKVLVPALADLTVLNHRNTREGAPCIAAGRCSEIKPEAILKSGEGSEEIPLRVVLKKTSEIDGDVCHVALVETVTSVIRGVSFFHERRQEVAERAAADCR
jgi:hypothetical protein